MIRDGELLVTPKEGARRGGFKFCSIGSVPLELVQPGGAIRDVNAISWRSAAGAVSTTLVSKSTPSASSNPIANLRGHNRSKSEFLSVQREY